MCLNSSHHALQNGLDKTAVAVRTPPQGASKSIKAQFMREMALAQRVGQHSNVAGFIGQCSKAQPLMIVSELCGQGNLRDHLRGSRASNSVTMEMRMRFAHEVASGMAYLEGRGIVHGDLAAYVTVVMMWLWTLTDMQADGAGEQRGDVQGVWVRDRSQCICVTFAVWLCVVCCMIELQAGVWCIRSGGWRLRAFGAGARATDAMCGRMGLCSGRS